MPDYLTSDVWDEYFPPSIIARDDLTYLVNKAERELVQHYTRQKKDVRFRIGAIVSEVQDGTDHLRDSQRETAVFLRYYKPTAEEVDTSDTQKKRFVGAMRAEIAGIVEHWVDQEGRSQGVTSKSEGSRSISFEDGDVRRLPDGFGRYLEPFDLRPKTTHI